VKVKDNLENQDLDRSIISSGSWKKDEKLGNGLICLKTWTNSGLL
jgi:hypothetical protein